jgi:ABC-type uncharacterized transport system substrate-binding protein
VRGPRAQDPFALATPPPGSVGEQLGLLRELRPGAARIAVLVDPKFPTTERFVSEVRAAASAMGQQVEVLYVGSA